MGRVLNLFKSKNTETISMTPKGLIFISLGGYVGEENGLNTKKNTENVYNHLAKRLGDGTVLVSENNKLYFAKLKNK